MFRSNDLSLLLGGYGLNLANIFAEMDAENAKEARKVAYEKYGIEFEEKSCGSPKLNIPIKYMDLTIEKGYLYFYYHDEVKIDLYDNTGKFLFTGISIKNIGKGFFLVEEKENTNKDSSDKLSRLHNINGFVSEHYYRFVFDTRFTEFGYCQLGCVETNKNSKRKYCHVIIDESGKEVFINSGMSDYLYLKGIIVNHNKGYTNLLTGKLLCGKSYSGSNDTKNYLFVREGEKMNQINFHTGELTIWE